MIFAGAEVFKRVYDEMGIKRLISPYGLTERISAAPRARWMIRWRSE